MPPQEQAPEQAPPEQAPPRRQAYDEETGVVNVEIHDDGKNVSMTKMGRMPRSTRRTPVWCNKWTALLCVAFFSLGVILAIAVPLGIKAATTSSQRVVDSTTDTVSGSAKSKGKNWSSSSGDSDSSTASSSDMENALDNAPNENDINDSIPSMPAYWRIEQFGNTIAPPDYAGVKGVDGFSSPAASQDAFGGKVAMGTPDNGQSYTIAVTTVPHVNSVAQGGLVHVFSMNKNDAKNWEFQQTLRAKDEDGISHSNSHNNHDDDAAPFQPALDMSEDGQRIAFTSQDGNAAVVFVHDQETKEWTQLGQNIHPYLDDNDDQADDDIVFSDVSISADGDTLAVKCVKSQWSAADASATVRIYEDVATGTEHEWRLRDEISLPSMSHEGGTLALDYTGSTLAVGQYAQTDAETTGFASTAAVSVYSRNSQDGTWSTVGSVLRDSGGVVHLSGDGQTLVVGSLDGHANAVTVWRQQASSSSSSGSSGGGVEWVPVGTNGAALTNGDEDTNHYSRFGASVHLNYDGTRLAVGAPGTPSLMNQSSISPSLVESYSYGSVYVYNLDTTVNGWVQIESSSTASPLAATIRGATQGDDFGVTVSINGNGDEVLVGAPLGNANGVVTAFEIRAE